MEKETFIEYEAECIEDLAEKLIFELTGKTSTSYKHKAIYGKQADDLKMIILLTRRIRDKCVDN